MSHGLGQIFVDQDPCIEKLLPVSFVFAVQSALDHSKRPIIALQHTLALALNDTFIGPRIRDAISSKHQTPQEHFFLYTHDTPKHSRVNTHTSLIKNHDV